MKFTKEQVEREVRKFYDSASKGHIAAVAAIFLLPGGVFILSYIFYKKYKEQIKKWWVADLEVIIKQKGPSKKNRDD